MSVWSNCSACFTSSCAWHYTLYNTNQHSVQLTFHSTDQLIKKFVYRLETHCHPAYLTLSKVAINDLLNVILHLYNKSHNFTQRDYVLMIIDRIWGPISQLKGHAFLIRRRIIQYRLTNEIESISAQYH